MKMKVLFTANIPSPYRVDFFNELAKYCDLTVLFEIDAASNRNSKWFKEKNKNYNEIILKGIKLKADTSLSFTVTKWLNDSSFDAIIIGGYSTLTGILSVLYLKFKKIPFILNVDGGYVKDESKLKYSVKKFLISAADYWLSSGKTSTNYLINYGASDKRIGVYPFTSIFNENIIKSPLSKKEKFVIRHKLNINEEIVIISVGRIIYSKGFDILLSAAKKLDVNVGIYIVGGKPTLDLQQYIEDNKLCNINFVDFMDKEELYNYYFASDIFVLPTRGDVWGLVINEAMSTGLPIITTDKCVAGLELIENGVNGFVVESDNSDELADKLNELIHDKNLRFKMAVNNIEKISNYTIEKMAEKTNELISEFLN